MARAHGRQSIVKIDDSGGTLRDISNDVDSCEVPSSADTAEVSGFGDVRKSYVVGLMDNTVQMSGPFNDAAAPGVHSVLSGLIGGTAGYSFEYHPAGTASGKPKITGEVFLSNYSVNSPIGGRVSWSATLVAKDNSGLVWSTN